MIRTIQTLAKEVAPKVQNWRHHIHANPELSFEEFETARFVSDRLTEFGIEHQHGVAGTGVVGLIKGRNPESRILALRGDMDALPIVEQNEVSYKSTKPGIMHACGHDVHTSSLLGASWILQQVKDQFEGTIKLIFQPGEEKVPGGASLLIKEGVLQNPAPQSIVGQHVMPFLPVGKVGFREGLYMASADEIYLTIHGKGGHGAMPNLAIDVVAISAQVITALQQVVSRSADPKIPSVLSFGTVMAKGATNILPNSIYLEGTFRTMDEDWRAKAHQKIRQIVEGICESFGAKADLEIRKGYPFLKNDPVLTRKMKKCAQEYLGAENVVDLDIWMAAEDFSYYTQEMPGCFYRLGTRNEEKGIVSGVHTPTFDIDEDALEIGCGLMAWLAINE
ncbi:MAG TPA: M20 family metallopeptidase [Catalimonadaceae bacterium]|nr:M20 family metallopeptidase [Catalimonadaceae bacterium]